MRYLGIVTIVAFLHSCDESPIEQIKIEKEEIAYFMNPEVPPSFPGGMMAMAEFVAENLKHPIGSVGCVEGKVLFNSP